MGFAKYASDQYAHRGSWSYTPSHTIDSAQGYSSDSELKVLLKGLGKGAYIRLHKTGGGSDHSVVIANADSSSVTVYEANYSWKCDVGMRTLTYAQFRNQYAYIVKSFAHSFDGSAIKYDADYHKVKCSLSGCNGFIYGSHYAQSPGANATCLACGYKGNISIGIMSARDELL